MTKLSEACLRALRDAGTLAEGRYRAVVIESDARIVTRDFAELDSACAYANDVVAEGDWPAPLAWIVDHRFEVVHQGQAYFA